MPLISVIIPTRYRPQLLQRAIDSVLSQTCGDFEIIVIVDGLDPETVSTLEMAHRERVTVLALEHNVGLAEARNVGVRHARGKWVAFLDDDDEWLSEKLQFQVEAAIRLGGDYVFVACRFIERTQSIERVMPETLPTAGQHFSEYIYCEGGYLQPSTFFASRALLLAVPFTTGLRHIEDTDWLLRAMSYPQVRVAVVPDSLSVYNNYKDGARESKLTPWGVPLAWAKTHHHLFTRRAFPFYIARLCLDARRARRPMSTFVGLLWLASRYGSVNGKVLGYFLAYSFVSDENLKRLRRLTKVFSRGAQSPQPSMELR
jgi:glycosyltransferase involved in cell wall biosynthesis